MAAPKLLLIFLLITTTYALSPDTLPLLSFKSSSDKSNYLASWNASTNPCVSWLGVSCVNGRVTRLVLEGMQLTGSTLFPLPAFTQLRVLSLKNNLFNATLPDLSNLTSLKLLFLAGNNFSGDFPASLLSLTRLYRLDLSDNRFSGDVPAGVNGLTHLLTLRLQGNDFSGSISSLDLPNLQDFNISGNKVSGEIPVSLSGFPGSAFGKNPFLCGYPLKSCTGNPTRPDDSSNATRPGGVDPTVTSSPSTIPSNAMPDVGKVRHGTHNGERMSHVAIIFIIIGDVLVLAIVALLIYCYFWRNYVMKIRNGKGQILEGEKIVYSASPYTNPNPGQPGFERGKMVFFEGARRFELEDLLRASAEMLGKGGFGTAYKAVLDDGSVVAVKRLKEAAMGGRKEFETQMEVLGRLRHPNLVALKAYYFAKDERLLVCDYMPNGNLFWLLHGNRGPGRTPLDWNTRLKIASGAATGIAYIHTFSKSPKLTHGNIKSTNILLDKDFNVCVADFGLSAFSPPHTTKSNGYRAPESSDSRKTTQKTDVYSFGVLLLELLTGKCPSVLDNGVPEQTGILSGYGTGAVDLPRWVQSVVREEWTAEVFDLELMRYKDIEEEMVGLLQIAVACTSVAPDQRPTMSYVVKMIEEIRGVELSPSQDNTQDSASDSPGMCETTR